VTISRRILAAVLLFAPLPAQASPAVSLDSAVYVEHVQERNGTLTRNLEPANRLNRGERVVTLVNWYMLGGSGGFTVVNAIPAGLAYQGSADGGEDVSVDGGKTWGKLAQLHVGGRSATVEDVTHVRWRVSSRQALNGAGRIAYAGFVR
jgi:hypothetical protein